MQASPQTTKPPPWHWLAIAAVALAHTWFYYREMLSGPYVLNDDMVQHYLWLFVDHFELNWKDTFYADASAAIQPRGFYWLLWGLGRVFEPLTISRGGPFLISLLTVGYGVALLRRYTHVFIAVAGSLLAVHLGFHTSVGFLARSFLMPLLLAFGYYLLRGDRPWGVAAVAVASALFYPPALLLNGGIFGLWKAGELIQWFWGRGRRMQGKVEGAKSPPDLAVAPASSKSGPGERERAERASTQKIKNRELRIENQESRTSPLHHWYIYLLGFALALMVVLSHANRVETHPTLGGYLPTTELMKLPEFGRGGRVDIAGELRAGPVRRLSHYFYNDAKTPLGRWFGSLTLVLVVVFTGLRFRRLGRLGAWLIVFGLASVVLFFCARSEFPLLFLPNRYLVYPWRLWVPLLFTFSLAAVWSYHPRTWLAALLACLLLGLGYYRQPPEKIPRHIASGRAYLFEAIAQLPEEAVVALPPHMANQVPVFAHRNVFISYESAHALYFRNYHNYVVPRYNDYITAMTATDGDLTTTVAFMDKWDIDYLLIDRDQLREAKFSAFSPFRKQFEDRLKDTDVADRTLLHLPDSVGTLIRGRLHLVSRGELEGLVE
jgi:hypothetical protein